MSKVVVVCGDAGGGLALLPVINKLRDDGVEVKAFAYRATRSLWKYYNVEFIELSDLCKIGDVTRMLKDEEPQIVITGTSLFNGTAIEKLFILAAKSFGIPTLSVLDFWGNYIPRFSDDGGNLVYLPDKIAVMDETAFCEMCEHGIEARRLVITGQPAYEDLIACKKSFSKDMRKAMRDRFDVGDGYLVLFASQPIESLYGMSKGYTERMALDTLVNALDRISGECDKHITLLVRPHPREDISVYDGISSDRIKIVVSKDWNYRYQAMASDVVVGMTTALLIEACYLGCIVMSIQPGLEGEDMLPTNRMGWSYPVYHESETYYLLRTLLIDEKARKKAVDAVSKIKYNTNATENVIRLMYSMMGVW